MSTADTYIRARIDNETKERATRVLDAMGLNVSTAIRLLMTRVAAEGRLPFAVELPNRTTRAAIEELESGQGKQYASVDAMFLDGVNGEKNRGVEAVRTRSEALKRRRART